MLVLFISFDVYVSAGLPCAMCLGWFIQIFFSMCRRLVNSFFAGNYSLSFVFYVCFFSF